MFKHKTVFVVGAGASYEAGLPVGDELARIIARKLDFTYEGGRLNSGDAIIAEAADIVGRHGGFPLGAFVSQGKQMTASLPLAISIDNYMHTHSENPLIQLLGKLAITSSILEAEAKSDFFCQTQETINFDAMHLNYVDRKRTPSWHNVFFKMLTEDVKCDALADIFQNVSVITFNYDRCIEHYLESAFAQFMMLDRQEARELRQRLEIIHPYGTVGILNGNEPIGTTFGGKAFGEQLFNISQQIRTFTEQIEDGNELEKMRVRLTEAETIIFLGFAYGNMNLRLMSDKREVSSKTVIGTAFHISDQNRAVIDRQLRDTLTLERSTWLPLTLDNTTCHDLLNNHWKSIMR